MKKTLLSALISFLGATQAVATPIFINEFHYDNAGTDTNEFIEVLAPAGTDLTGFSLVLYNGSNGASYDTLTLTGSVADLGNGFGTHSITLPTNGLQNGAPDGIALVDNAGSVVQFLSYEGTMAAADGPAQGMTSTDVGVAQIGTTPVGASLQLTGTGSQYQDFVWAAFDVNTKDDINTDQVLKRSDVLFINEFHYDNTGTDVGEFIEVAGTSGQDVSGWTIVLYNGSNGSQYNTLTLNGVIPDQASGWGTLSVAAPGLQNGSPDGFALVNAQGEVVQFLSYEGSFVAVGGPADGMQSIDVGVTQSSSTPAGDSLYLVGQGTAYEAFTWTSGQASEGNINSGQSFADSMPSEPTDPETPDYSSLFINELHYDNDGTDVDEFVEIVGPAGLSLDGVSIELYNGNGGGVYATVALSGTLPEQQNGFGAHVTYISGIQNGSPDAVALVYNGQVLDFISYEGELTATSGTASGMTAADIGVAQNNTPLGLTLQRTGAGRAACEFSWVGPVTGSPGQLNVEQTITLSVGECGGETPVDPEPPVGVATLISAVQGEGNASTLVGQMVTVEAIVVGDFQAGSGVHGALNGFFVQEEDADADNNPLTSEGIFIFDGSTPAVDVVPGDKVRVTGVVAEFFGDTQINVTSGSVSIVSSGNSLPMAAVVPFPRPLRANANGQMIADFEAYEGMRVVVEQTMTITELFNLDRFGEILLSASGVEYQYTERFAPSVEGVKAYEETAAANRLMLDDGLSIQNPSPIRFPAPGLTTDNAVRLGDDIINLTGVLTYRRASGGTGTELFRLMPTAEPVFTATSPREQRPEVGGRLQVASFNVLNFFNSFGNSCFIGDSTNGQCRGANNATEYARQLEKTVTAITQLNADIIGLIEIENDVVEGANSALAVLTQAVNAATDAQQCSEYDYVNPQRRVGTDAIMVAFMYCKDSVEIADGSQIAVLDDSQLAAIGMAEQAPIFDGGSTSRPPLAVTFAEKATGETLTVTVNHFKSKGGSASGENADQGDGQAAWNARRVLAAEALSRWLATNPTGNTDPDILIIGDLNAYSMEDPITLLKNKGYANVIQDENAYSYVFNGYVGNLDHGLASESLTAQMTGAAPWNINAPEADALDYNTDFGRPTNIFDGSQPWRASDHDPLVMGFDLASRVRGDWDGDGDVDQNDFTGLVRAIARRQPIDMAFDLNNDGVVNTRDARELRTLCTRRNCAVE